jgi:hypothetical protein
MEDKIFDIVFRMGGKEYNGRAGERKKGKGKKSSYGMKRFTVCRIPFTVHYSLFTWSMFREKGKRSVYNNEAFYSLQDSICYSLFTWSMIREK